MSTWFIKNLGDAMLSGESLEHIKALFVSKYKQTDDSKAWAIFVRHESEGRLHCEVKVYFPPATVVVAQAVGARACMKPSSAGLGLLAGSEESRSLFFPDKNPG